MKKVKGIALIELVIGLSVSAMLLTATLLIMNKSIKNAYTQLQTSYKDEKLYRIMNTILYHIGDKSSNNMIYVSDNKLINYDKTKGKTKILYKNIFGLRLDLNGTTQTILNDVQKFSCKQKGNIIYILIKLNSGEEIRECIRA